MNKYIVILIRKMYFFNCFEDEHIKLIYDDSNKIKAFLRKVFSRICPNLLFIFFGKWKKVLNQLDYIIIMDNAYNSFISKYIKKKNPNIKIIFYYWNIINEKNSKFLNDKNIDSFWTFDENDAKKYNLKYSPQFYKPIELCERKIEYDVTYLGAAKDRENEIITIENDLKKQKLNTNILISHKGDKLKTYEEYLDMINISRGILDVVGKKQTGITLRVLEALFYNKKLITNNKNIINYPFYSKNNIFIVGIDNMNDIGQFLIKSNDEIDLSIINKYSYEKWIENLINDEEFI